MSEIKIKETTQKSIQGIVEEMKALNGEYQKLLAGLNTKAILILRTVLEANDIDPDSVSMKVSEDLSTLIYEDKPAEPEAPEAEPEEQAEEQEESAVA